MRNPLSSTIVTIPPSGIRKFFDVVNEMEGAISLGVGEPDFDTPWHVRDAGIRSLEMGKTFYTSNAGLKELKVEICNYMKRRMKVEYNYSSEVMVTIGGSEAIAVPSVEQFKKYQEAARGHIRYITIAPEHDKDMELLRYLAKTGVVASMGHSCATYEQAMAAIANGAKSMTHVYNGMTPFTHRKPGLVGIAFRVRDIYGEIIADGHHSDVSVAADSEKLQVNASHGLDLSVVVCTGFVRIRLKAVWNVGARLVNVYVIE